MISNVEHFFPAHWLFVPHLWKNVYSSSYLIFKNMVFFMNFQIFLKHHPYYSSLYLSNFNTSAAKAHTKLLILMRIFNAFLTYFLFTNKPPSSNYAPNPNFLSIKF